ncbi:MAG: flagellar biosynthesis protein FliQ [Methylococcales bacterium]|jgi:flagellar biosynthetic protein FliQ|nr:flagellar biosynthesis protein FliQ [Methylococcales bacterium]MBT7410707.1 flagellar biosynthesis protein FliQ [Methylococcales bacterium]
MDEGMIIDLGQQVLQLVAMLLAPIMGTSMIVGLLISMFQAATQIQEMTLTFVPKLAMVGGVLVISAPWMLDMITGFTIGLFERIPDMIG